MRAGRYAHSAQNFDRYITVTSTYIIRGNLKESNKDFLFFNLFKI